MTSITASSPTDITLTLGAWGAWFFHGTSRTLVSLKPLHECRPDLGMAQHNFVYRVQPGSLKVAVWREVAGNGESINTGDGHQSGVSSSIYGVIVCDDPAVRDRASVVIATFPSKQKAEAALQAFVAGVEEVLARVPLSQPEPVEVQADGGAPAGSNGIVTLPFRLKGWRASTAEFTRSLTPVRFFPRVLLGRMTMAAWDAAVAPLARMEQPPQMPNYMKLLICPPIGCLGGICYLMMKMKTEEKNASDHITTQAVELLAQPAWKVKGALRQMDQLSVEIEIPVGVKTSQPVGSM
eukprot:m.394688 g.394688  ORF g.394688 m.394688 type:complete len:295 (-) comp16767_c0_seq24:351-1235(-)